MGFVLDVFFSGATVSVGVSGDACFMAVYRALLPSLQVSLSFAGVGFGNAVIRYSGIWNLSRKRGWMSLLLPPSHSPVIRT